VFVLGTATETAYLQAASSPGGPIEKSPAKRFFVASSGTSFALPEQMILMPSTKPWKQFLTVVILLQATASVELRLD
jgi:hypothetical protein